MTSEGPIADPLPRPATDRWQPLRLGLVDLFYYDDEQFWFHDGRLLLRGNNGTGKSKVLALTLPLLLDGSLQSRRVEPDADPKKRMDWNLLLGGAHPTSERTGYSWIEFGRVESDGTEHFRTLGIGLKAAAGRGIVKHWFFTTTRRIGDLRLLDDQRTVLSQERLRTEVEGNGSGQVHSTRDAYRRAVDEQLFRLGEDRYGALIDLLIQLRQPQLSKRPDEKMLSAALTEALAPLDQAVVADVAESFRSLEEERGAIEDVRDTLGATESFLRHYRSYARVASRRHTTAVRLVNSQFEHAGRALRETEEGLSVAVTEAKRVTKSIVVAEERQGALMGQERALRESPEMRDAEQLDRARQDAADLGTRAERAVQEAQVARERDKRSAEQSEQSARRHTRIADEAARLGAAATTIAGRAGLAAEHASAVADADTTLRVVQRRRDQVAHVRRLIAVQEEAQQQSARLRIAVDEAETTAVGRAEELRLAGIAVDAAVTRFGAEIAAYLNGLVEAVPETGAEELAGLAQDWARSQDGESPALAAVTWAARLAMEELGSRRAEAEQEVARLEGELATVTERIDQLEAGQDPEPETAPGRDRSARADGAGAPLWRVTDFAEGVPDGDRAGIEAALQSAGLLDAWLFPDGTMVADGDVVLSSIGPVVARAGALAAVLVPAVGPQAPVPEEVVVGVLARIGFGADAEAPWWVDRDGRWGAGPALGSWAKERAEFIGAGAREGSRRDLLTRLQANRAGFVAQTGVAREILASIRRRLDEVGHEQSRYPSAAERALGPAHTQVAAAEREAVRARQDVERTHEVAAAAAQRSEVATAELAEVAEDLGLGTSEASLDATLDTVTDYREALADVRRAVLAETEALQAQDEAIERAAETAAVLASRETDAAELRTQAATRRAHADALQETVGASVAELQSRLEQVSDEASALARELKRLSGQQLQAEADRATLAERERELATRRHEADDARAQVTEALRAFAGTGVLRVALADLEVPDPAVAHDWSLTAALGLARTAEQRLDGADESDEAWNVVQQRMSTAHTDLAAQMSRHGHTAVMEQRGDVLVARVRYHGDEVPADRLADRLTDDLAERERLLSAREREILENHLVNEVAGHLHELLLSAQGQIDRMNRELVERKTSTGMQLRVIWRERGDGPAGLAAARDLMFRSDATWTAEDRAAIGGFLQARIAEVREADPTGSWQEHLENALDYRQWHAFVVERRQNGQWRSASGPASGGERVLAMSVPLFAAASAHYNSASPLAPRLILLDEAFAGVDDDSRAKSLGLLATFDLDVVMTSEREWGCYPQVPGLAIAQLSRMEGVDAVGVTRWRWDGLRRERLGELDGAALAGSSADPGENDQYDGTLLG